MKKALVISFIVVLLLSLVSGVRLTKKYPGTTVTSEFEEKELLFVKGWNLVQGVLSPDWIQTNRESIKAIYAFNPITKEYVRFYPNPEDNKIGGSNYQWESLASIGALWIYSDKEFSSKYWKFSDFPLDSTTLFAGWNFVSITDEMTGKYLQDIKGSCDITKVVAWLPNTQEWDSKSGFLNLYFNDRSLEGKGIVVKVSSDCKLGSSDLTPPAIPGLPGDGTSEKSCTDSDGGLNYNIKGIASDSRAERLEDFCVDSTKLNEAICNVDNLAANAEYNCPKGCKDGACIR